MERADESIVIEEISHLSRFLKMIKLLVILFIKKMRCALLRQSRGFELPILFKNCFFNIKIFAFIDF